MGGDGVEADGTGIEDAMGESRTGQDGMEDRQVAMDNRVRQVEG